MDLELHSPPDSAGAKASFHKPSNDPANRKYRRRSPVSGSSSSDGEPDNERSSTPTRSLDGNSKLNDNQQRRDDKCHIDRDHKRSHCSRDVSSYRSSKRTYDHHRHDDRRRREKYADEDDKNFSRARSGSYGDHARRESDQNRTRDNLEKHRSDGSGHRSRDKHRRDKTSERLPTSEEPRVHRGGHHKDPSRRDSTEPADPKYTRVEKGKLYDQGLKERYFKEPKDLDDTSVLVRNNDSSAKKSKFSGKDANEGQSSSSKQANAGQECLKESDIDAAKIAAMKAAELVNRNLIGTGFMSTDQKKKLLWGSKKSSTTEEAGHRWDTSMFSDRERQEKFKKLMGVKAEQKAEVEDGSLAAEKQKELQIELEKQYTAGLRRRDGRTVGLGL